MKTWKWYVAPVIGALIATAAAASLPYTLHDGASFADSVIDGPAVYDPKRKKCPIGGCTPPNPVR